MQDLKTWRCGHCPLTFDIPSERYGYEYADAIARVREHRFGHLVSALESESDDELWRLCDDEPASSDPILPEDKECILAGITELLRADLPRARQLWYPTNEDGSFNR